MAKPETESEGMLLAVALLALTFVVTDLLKQFRKLREANERLEHDLAGMRAHQAAAEDLAAAEVLEGEVVDDVKAPPRPTRKRGAARVQTSPDPA